MVSNTQIQEKTQKQTTIAMEKLAAKDGDIIVVTFPNSTTHPQMKEVATYMESAIPDGITVFCTREEVSIKLLPKSRLNGLGWYNINDNCTAPSAMQ